MGDCRVDACHQHAAFPAAHLELQNDAEDAARGAGNQTDPGQIQEVLDARSAKSGDEQGSDGRLLARGNQPRWRLLPDVFADAHLVWVELDVAFGDRDASCALVWMDHRSFGTRSLLRIADRD